MKRPQASPAVKRRKRRVVLATTAAALAVGCLVLVVMWLIKPVEWTRGGAFLQVSVSEGPGGQLVVSMDKLELRMDHRVAIEIITEGLVRERWWWEKMAVKLGAAPNSGFVSGVVANRREELLVAIADELARHPTRGMKELANGPSYSRLNLARIATEISPFLIAWGLVTFVCGMVLWQRYVRRPMLRAASGRCFACGYEIGVSGQTTCPECGKDVSNWMEPNPAERNS